MKTRLIFLFLLIICFSCGTNNKPVSDAQKEKIKGEVKEVVNNIIKGSEEANFDMVTEPWLDSPDFVLLRNGKTYSYKEVMAVKPVFDLLSNQKCTIVDEKYSVIDNFTVLYTADSKWSVNYKDGHSTLEDPEAIMFMLKKIEGKWKVTYFVDSFIEKTVKYSEPSKEINQVELMKQFIGTWKGETGKDTIAIVDYALFGTAIEFNIKIVTKGKTIASVKGLWGYDKENDKFINAEIWNYSPNISLYSVWFTSKNTCEGIAYKNISNPENSPSKTNIEFKSPDSFIETELQNDKVVSVWTFTRVKK
jgi:hypothetical protein